MKRFAAVLFFLALPSFVFAAGFDRDLYFGMTGNPDVVRLQDFLRGQGFLAYPLSTGNYFVVTMNAVKKFQAAHGLLALGGYFGSQSRAVANRLMGEARPVYSSGPLLSVPAAAALSTTSPYKGKIAIGYVSGWGTVPEYESMTLENKSEKEIIPITGFRIENSRGGVFAIPQGQEIPGISGAADATIFLKPGDRAIITPGRQDRHMNFRENLCTGYFDETSNFIPSLSHACPRQEIKTLGAFSDSCLAIISSLSYCRTAPPSFPSRVPDSSCNDYIANHFSYVGCVADYRTRSDFYSHNWLIWMQRDREFFRNPLEHVIVKDQQGKTVDEYSY